VISSVEYVPCNLCGRDTTRLLYVKQGMATRERFRIVQCRNCSLVYVNPRPSRSAVADLYDRVYFEQRFPGEDPARIRLGRVLARGLQSVLPPDAREPLKWLDVGGGKGSVARGARELGFIVSLVDISAVAVSTARELGIESYRGEPTDCYFDGKSYDVITALEVLEHCYDPKALICRIYELLRPGGVFFFTTGNADGIRLRRTRWAYFKEIPYHVYFYSSQTMDRYLRSAGFREFLDPYQFVLNDCDTGIRILTRMGLVHPEKDCHLASPLARFAYSHAFPLLATLSGRRKYPIARKTI
jgi:2-polyprenyl-3-methyl-5-hydroxy-6-metoxy-1,4-benzoquinol methylase